jgi:phenylacetate-coenzyme A ligase PaaK-like adenylate-forming protein
MRLDAPRAQQVSSGAMFVATAARHRLRPRSVLDRQRAAAQRMLHHAADRVPAYAGVLDGVRELADAPIVDKAHFLALDPGRRAWIPDGLTHGTATTSGTTGQPFPVPWSRWAAWRNRAQRLWMMRGMGLGPLSSHVSLTLSSRVEPGPREGRLASRRHALAEDRDPHELAADLRRLRTDWISGEPHILVAVGEALDGAVRPRRLSSYGVALDPTMRADLHRLYGTPPLDIYGSAECGQMAWQCRHADLYHVNHEILLVEVVDDDDRAALPGQPGHILLTGLINPLLPMIRYRVGDGGSWADRPCACGDPLPALATIEGRTFDWLVDDTGARVAPQRLWLSAISLDRLSQAARYRVAQDRAGKVTIEVVPGPGFTAEMPAEIVQHYRETLGEGTPVDVLLVDRIETPPGKRFRQFTSERTPTR